MREFDGQWAKNAKEKNVSVFEVFKSHDGNSFYKVRRITNAIYTLFHMLSEFIHVELMTPCIWNRLFDDEYSELNGRFNLQKGNDKIRCWTKNRSEEKSKCINFLVSDNCW